MNGKGKGEFKSVIGNIYNELFFSTTVTNEFLESKKVAEEFILETMKNRKKEEKARHFKKLRESVDFELFYYHPYMLKKMLGEGHVFQISIFLDQGLRFYNGGIYNPENATVCRSSTSANHVLTLVGYDDEKGYWILFDSNAKGNGDDTLWFK